MQYNKTNLAGCYVVEPRVFEDPRGFFLESYNHRVMQEAHPEMQEYRWVQDNHSQSARGTLRGMHMQAGAAGQTKLLRCVRGVIFDVAIDMNPSSSTYKQWFGIELSEYNRRMLLVPSWCAHGFLVLSEAADVLYKTDNYYSKEHEAGVRWDDPSVGIEWPGEVLNVNTRDSGWPLLPR